LSVGFITLPHEIVDDANFGLIATKVRILDELNRYSQQFFGEATIEAEDDVELTVVIWSRYVHQSSTDDGTNSGVLDNDRNLMESHAFFGGFGLWVGHVHQSFPHEQ
jgi:hypothetical protein